MSASPKKIFTKEQLCDIIGTAWSKLGDKHQTAEIQELPENRRSLMGLMAFVKERCPTDKQILLGAIVYAAATVKKEYEWRSWLRSPDNSALYASLKEIYESLDSQTKLAAIQTLQDYVHNIAYEDGNSSNNLRPPEENRLHAIPGLEDDSNLRALIVSVNHHANALSGQVEKERAAEEAAKAKAEAEASRTQSSVATPGWRGFGFKFQGEEVVEPREIKETKETKRPEPCLPMLH